MKVAIYISLFAAALFSFANPLFAQWVHVPLNQLVNSFASSPNGSGGRNLFAGTESAGVFLSTDDGASWTAVNNGLTDLTVFSLTISDTNIFAGTVNSGVFRSTNNGASWIDVSAGFTGLEVWSLAVSDTNLFAGTLWYGVHRSTNNGNSWSYIGLHYAVSLLVSGTDLFAGTAGAGMYLSTNNGSNWTEISNGLPAYLPIYSITECQNATNGNREIFIGGTGSSGGVFRTTDNGVNWNQFNEGLTNLSVQALATSGSNLFAGTGFFGGVFLLTRSNSTWIPINEGFTYPFHITSLCISGDYIFAGTLGYGVWRRPLSDFIPVELTSFSAVVSNDNIVLSWITSTETNNRGFEIQKSKNGEFETIGFVDGHGTTTEMQVYSFIDKNLLGGKYNYRLKQIDFDGTFEYSNVVEVEVTSPSTFSLEQNYPNPFNPSTKIRYTIPNVIASGAKQSQLVTLKVYDVLGNEIITLINEEKPAGSYEIEFSAEGLTSGVYFYKLQAGSFVETKKMVLMR